MIEVYGKDGCVFCEKAVSLLNDRGVVFKYHKLGTDISVEDFRQKFPEQKTVPMITTYGFNIGGYDALLNYLEEVSGGYGH